MALIKCPHCGKEVSDTVTTCVHCGGRYKLCAECHNVLDGEAERCPNCGRVFKNEEFLTKESVCQDAISKESASEKMPDLIAKWEKEKPLDYKLVTSKLFIVRIVFSVICAGSLMLWLLLFQKWAGKDALTRLTEIDDLKKKEQWLAALLGIASILYQLIFFVKGTYVKIRCGRWLATHNVDIAQYINTYLKSCKISKGNIVANKNAVKVFLDCAYHSKSPTAYKMEIGYNFLLSVCIVLSMAFLSVWLTKVIDGAAEASFYSTKIKFSEFIDTWFILGMIFYASQLAVTSLGRKFYNDRFKTWLEKNISVKDWLLDSYPKIYKVLF